MLVDLDSRTVAMKSESAKECVTTHLPNQPAPKMDDAKPSTHSMPMVSKGKEFID